ncbi:MAG: hypothetical protein IJS94_03700 [Clostridia bacterium]|nr:hypothetical protein [Clostridia bacterium]
MFRKKRGIHIDYPEQGLIYFTCLTYGSQSERVKKRIRKVCEKVGGGYAEALFEFITTEKSATEIALRNYVSESTLYDLRRKFYHAFFDLTKK